MADARSERVFTIFDEALARPEEERAAFLKASCGTDAQLLKDVQALLTAHALAGGTFSGQPRPPSLDGAASSSPSLQPGSRVGVFAIEALVGAGGMGEVYRARDTRLGRTVAIKVLQADVASDPDRRSRFEREARAISALNHPHICTLHDVGHENGVDFLVMEFVEGESLASRIASGPIPLAQILRYAVEVAEALEKAHEHGIVHRDLKPGNIMLTKSGVKLLDFGLAKLQGDGISFGDAQPTMTRQPLTGKGIIVGTLHYMAPEQLAGRNADARTDIFAFGAVLYEMLTGTRAFDGDSQARVITSIMSSDPAPIRSVQPAAPVALERLVRICLAKDRDERWASIHDVLLQLRSIDEAPDVAGVDTRQSRREIVAWTIAAVLALAVAGSLLLRPRSSADQARTTAPLHLSLLPPQGASLATEEAPLISPDGLRVAFVASDAKGRRELYLQALNSSEAAKPLANSEGASQAFWSPDSASLGFFSQGKLKTITLDTSRVVTLADADGARGGTWSRDNVILFVPRPLVAPSRVPATGGDVTPLKIETGGPQLGWYPSFLPDGKHFLFLITSPPQPENAAVYVGSLDSPETKRLVNAKSNAFYVSPGYLVFWRDGTLLAQPFDSQALEMRGNPVPIVQAAGLNPLINLGLFSVSDAGSIAFFAGSAGQSQLQWIDRAGKRLGAPGSAGILNSISLAPDDSAAVYDEADPRTGSIDLWRLDFARGVPSRLTFHPSHDMFPIWSADGARIAFNSLRQGPPQLFELDANSSGNEQLLLATPLPKMPSGWSSDGRYLIFGMTHPRNSGDIWALPLTGAREPVEVLATPSDERYGVLSPDGRWLAYISNESAVYQVYVQAFPGPGIKRQVSTEGGTEPYWSRNGRELFYMTPEHALMTVDVRSTPASVDLGVPKVLFTTQFKSLEAQAIARHYAPASDGNRFLVSAATSEAEASGIRLVLNAGALLAAQTER